MRVKVFIVLLIIVQPSLITKDGETVAEETFDMSANELLECDFSECESGECTVSVAVGGAVQIKVAYV